MRIMIRRSLISSSVLALAVAAACATTSDTQQSDTSDGSDLRQQDGEELVEITIRLPDGRIINQRPDGTIVHPVGQTQPDTSHQTRRRHTA